MSTAWKAVGTAKTRVSFEYYIFRNMEQELHDLFYECLNVEKNLKEWIAKRQIAGIFIPLELSEYGIFAIEWSKKLEISNQKLLNA